MKFNTYSSINEIADCTTRHSANDPNIGEIDIDFIFFVVFDFILIGNTDNFDALEHGIFLLKVDMIMNYE